MFEFIIDEIKKKPRNQRTWMEQDLLDRYRGAWFVLWIKVIGSIAILAVIIKYLFF